jgi:putative acetyltransferase
MHERFPDAAFPARVQEYDLIEDLLQAAFPGPEEAGLVRGLRATGAMVRELVTPRDGRIVAYGALSRMVEPEGWLCLAPLAVLPEVQGQGLGSYLVRRLLAQEPEAVIVVLGDPVFYGRLGFSGARAARLQSDYPVSHLLIAGPGAEVPEARLVYPAAFDGV